jgi:allophanate hydrolase subunit 2
VSESGIEIEIVRAIGLCTVQGLPQPGGLHLGIPPAGALVPDLLVGANRAVRNPDDARAIEVQGQLVARTPDGEVVIENGQRRCAYLAVRGGIAERAALTCAELGRILRAGDRVPLADLPPVDELPLVFSPHDTIRIIPGPDLDGFAPDALEQLVAAPYRISPTSDRLGTRLEGTTIARNPAYRPRSRPMTLGAIEVPPDGQPIVLGPEHPATGGYPLIAVIAAADIGAFHAIRLGGHVRFATT